MAARAFENALRLERQEQASVFNLFNNVLRFERQQQDAVISLFKHPVSQSSPPPDAASPAITEYPTETPGALYPLDVSGFYKVTGPQEITFYVNSDTPDIKVGAGWTGEGFTGLIGQIQITGASYVKGATDYGAYNWYFTLQTDTDQNIEATQAVTGAFLYPPGRLLYSAKKVKAPIYGYYIVVKNVVTLYFTTPPPQGVAEGWIVSGLPTIESELKVVSFSRNMMSNYWVDETGTRARETFATLVPIDGSIPKNTTASVFVRGVPAMIREPMYTSVFVPGKITNFSKKTMDGLSNVYVEINSQIRNGNYPPQRDLNTDTAWTAPPSIGLFPESKYIESKGKGFSSGSILALEAIGPQEKYLLTDDMSKSPWNPDFKRHSNFVMYQKAYPFPPPSPVYQGQTVQIELRPTELGHLLSNMYLSVTLPALPTGSNYTTNVGRALIKQIDLLVNETVIETLYDDWYVIRDQLFLDADEQYGLQAALNVTNSQVQNNITIPLEFFFCRRHSHNNKGRERLRRPYFPMCAMWNQRLYVRFTFQPNTWWCNAPLANNTDIYPANTTLWPQLITEEILLDNPEKLYYQNTPLKFIVNRIRKESPLFYATGNPILQLTANYPVQTLAWFFRNKKYEQTTDGRYYNSRYAYGYTTQYITTGVELQFPSGTSNYVDVIANAKITLNNVDILSTFQGSLYYSFKQPIEHMLSIPSKNIYTYSFGLTPKEYNQGGYLDFSKLNSQTTTLTLTFLPTYTNQLVQGYNLYLFYYGYSLLQFQGGFASLPFL